MPLAGTPVVAWWTGRAQGDLRRLAMGTPPPGGLPAGLVVRRLRQEHGARVVVAQASAPGAPHPEEPPAGDALVAGGGGQALAVLTADCAALALGSPQGFCGVVHAGWRGLVAGVIENAVAALRGLGGDVVVAGIGPCIGPCCYAFDAPALDALCARYGEAVRARTSTGEVALDLAAAARAALDGAGARLVFDGSRCTGCQADAWSHRVRADQARQALLVWAEPPRP